jgi:hypothetical protein
MGKCLKTHNQKKKKKKTDLKNKTVVTIIFYGKLISCKRTNRYESLERTPIWEYPKIGPWFGIMTSVDADLRNGRRSESIIYRGGSRGAPGARPPKIGKNMFFWRKIVIFHMKYPKKFRASLRSAQFFLSAPPPPNLKSWICPCIYNICMKS